MLVNIQCTINATVGAGEAEFCTGSSVSNKFIEKGTFAHCAVTSQ